MQDHLGLFTSVSDFQMKSLVAFRKAGCAHAQAEILFIVHLLKFKEETGLKPPSFQARFSVAPFKREHSLKFTKMILIF